MPAEAEHAEAFGRICQLCFALPPALAPWVAALVGRPGWRTFVALDGARPVATAAFHVQGEWAWMGWSATLPSHRGEGAQLALIAEMRLQAGREGCRHLALETGGALQAVRRCLSGTGSSSASGRHATR